MYFTPGVKCIRLTGQSQVQSYQDWVVNTESTEDTDREVADRTGSTNCTNYRTDERRRTEAFGGIRRRMEAYGGVRSRMEAHEGVRSVWKHIEAELRRPMEADGGLHKGIDRHYYQA